MPEILGAFKLVGAASFVGRTPIGRDFRLTQGSVIETCSHREYQFFSRLPIFINIRDIGSTPPVQPASFEKIDGRVETPPVVSSLAAARGTFKEARPYPDPDSEGKLPCPICGKTFKNKAGLKGHIAMKHKDEKDDFEFVEV